MAKKIESKASSSRKGPVERKKSEQNLKAHKERKERSTSEELPEHRNTKNPKGVENGRIKLRQRIISPGYNNKAII